MRFLLALPFLLLALQASAAPGDRRVVDEFEDVSGWSAHPADGVKLDIGQGDGVHGRAIRFDVDFVRGGGYAVARRAVDIRLPANYRFHFSVRGDIAPEDLEFKLIDSTGANVWWMNRRNFTFPAKWDSLTTKKRQIEFAWGPLGGGELRHIASIEFAITAGSGGKGKVWIDDLTLEELPPADAPLPRPSATASSSKPGHEPAKALDGESQTSWQPGPGGEAALTIDYGVLREFSAVLLDWDPGTTPASYALERSDDGVNWRTIREVTGGRPRRNWIYTPEAEARFLRARVLEAGAAPPSLAEVRVEKPAWAPNPNEFFRHVAGDTRRGIYPRGMSGEQPYWTILGADRSAYEALIDEDGRIEPWKAGPSIEPFLLLEPQGLVTWYDVPRKTQSILDVGEPAAEVTWIRPDATLAVRASVNRLDRLEARYVVRNTGRARLKGGLVLAARPFQVNPPAQFLNTTGGVSAIGRVDAGERLALDDRPHLDFEPAPSKTAALAFDAGDLVGDYLARGAFPSGNTSKDPTGWASAAARFDFDLAPGDSFAVRLRTFLTEEHANPSLERPASDAVLEGPKSAQEALSTLRAQLHYARVTRDSVALMPGTRSYERSWIRDGALSANAFLRMGEPDVAKDFARWFARFVAENGAVPCCVDRRGADPTPEHDSHGEFVYLVAEILRYTGDIGLARDLWPAARRAAAHIDTLRAQRRTAEWQGTEFFGLLPPSISHEGYSAKPMHSYWDDFFGLRGLTDAAYLAERLELRDDAARFAASRDEFAYDLGRSIRAAQAKHKIAYIPGCADLGDYDATSTTIALDPVDAEHVAGTKALNTTFDGYWKWFRERRDGKQTWNDYTPYEVRIIGALARLGHRDRANAALAFFLEDRRPAGFLHWAEVVGRDVRKPRFIGDMPHTWVGTDYVRSVLDLFAYVRGVDSSLVVGAGLPRKWVAEAPGVRAELPTPFGMLSLKMQGSTCELGAMRVPPGGIVLAPPPPAGKRWRSASVDGLPAKLDPSGRVTVTKLPAKVEFR